MNDQVKPKPDVVIFDLDGCVSDDRWRQNLIPTPDVTDQEARAHAWDSYHAECDKDPLLPSGSAILRDHIRSGHLILFCTGRTINVGEKSASWITANFGITPDAFSILMRKAGDHRPADVLKKEFAEYILMNSKNNGQPVIAAYDDREDVVEMYRSLGINAAVLDKDGIHPPPPVVQHPVTAAAPTPFSGTVPELLVAAADLYRERNTLYKDDYKKIGAIWQQLLPEGANLKTQADFNRFSLMLMILAKVSRYARNFNEGGHGDSLNDLAVYAMMLKEVDDSLPV
jgi:hypothetical protein